VIAKLTTGTSFKGAASYLLQDKDAFTTDRVEWTDSNLLPSDPHAAVRLLTYWSMNQDNLKRRAGIKLSGRKLEHPVTIISLSWHPDEKPGREHMLESARSALQAMEWGHLPFLAICHNDEPHAHLHLLLGRVDPETGIAAPLWRSKTRLSDWAYAYEKEQGRVYCQQRVQNAKRRRKGKKSRYRDPVITKAFEASNDLASFSEQLKARGYELTQGRKLVVVDRWGKVHNPGRYLDKVERLRLKQWQLQGDLSELRAVNEAKREPLNDNASLSKAPDLRL